MTRCASRPGRPVGRQSAMLRRLESFLALPAALTWCAHAAAPRGFHEVGVGAGELEACARGLFESGGRGGDVRRCRVALLRALVRDEIPGYHYDAASDCHFWAQFAMRDRMVEFARDLAFARLMNLRLSEPFAPPLRRNGTVLYVGAHRDGSDGVYINRAYGLQVHLFEPSPTFFGQLREAVGNNSAFTLHNYGLGLETRDARLRIDGMGSTTLEKHDSGPQDAAAGEDIAVRSAAHVVRELAKQGPLELLHVNCEGCEYDVVKGLYEAKRLANFPQIQLATHLLQVPAGIWEATAGTEEYMRAQMEISARRYCEAHLFLAETHERVWGLPWVWERWTRRQVA